LVTITSNKKRIAVNALNKYLDGY